MDVRKALVATLIVCAALAPCSRGLSAEKAGYGEGPSPLKDWRIVLSNNDSLYWLGGESCFVFLSKAEKAKGREPWRDGLSQALDKLISAAIAGDAKAYAARFLPSMAPKPAEITREMADWKGYSAVWEIKKCAWGARRDGRLYFIVAATTNRVGMPGMMDGGDEKYGISHLRRVLYAVKKKDGFKFVSGFRDKTLERVFRMELYPSLAVYECRPKEEVAFSREYEKYIDGKRLKKQREEDEKWLFNAYFDEENIPCFKKLGYKRKDFLKLFQELKEYDDKFDAPPEPKGDIVGLYEDRMLAKYAIAKGYIKIFEKPILITGFEKEPPPNLDPEHNPLDYLFSIHHDAYLRDIKRRLDRKRIDDRCQVVAYCVRKRFRDYSFLDLWAISYSSNPGNTMVYVARYDCFVFDHKLKGWRQLQYPEYKEDETGLPDPDEIVRYPDEAYLLHQQVSCYLPQLNRIIRASQDDVIGCMTKRKYAERLKACNLFEAFRIRSNDECVPYKPGMDFSKLPTVDPRKFHFPKLDASGKQPASEGAKKN